MRPLYLRIYAAFVAVAVLCIATAGAVSWLWERGSSPDWSVNALQVVAERLPTEPAELARELNALAGKLGVEAAIWSADGELIARTTGAKLPSPGPNSPTASWVHGRAGPGVRTKLPDGRWIAAAVLHKDHHATILRFVGVLFAMALVVAIGCYPLARSITRRLEMLRDGVDRFGQGDLSARVCVYGRDEVAEVGRSFNASAERIEALVTHQKRVLANASHELRSPLARLRMAVELLDDGSPERLALIEEAARDIDELDALVGDVLLAARLESGEAPRRQEAVDLAEILAEEAQKIGLPLELPPAPLRGDPAMLRRLVRNLLENARRHGGGAVEAWIEPAEGALRLVVADRGPGVPESERERIFEPFHRAAGHAEGKDGGAGLGLSLVREIAEAHGGAARVLPREGGGSRFEVVLRVG